MDNTNNQEEGEEIGSTPSSFAALIPRLDAATSSSISSRRRRRRRWSSLARGETPMTPSPPPLPPLPYQLPFTSNQSEDDNDDDDGNDDTTCIIRNNLTQCMDNEHLLPTTQSSPPLKHHAFPSIENTNFEDNIMLGADSNLCHIQADHNNNIGNIHEEEKNSSHEMISQHPSSTSSSPKLTVKLRGEMPNPTYSQQIQSDNTDEFLLNHERKKDNYENKNPCPSNTRFQNDNDQMNNRSNEYLTPPKMKQPAINEMNTVTNQSKNNNSKINDSHKKNSLFGVCDESDNDAAEMSETLNEETSSTKFQTPQIEFNDTPQQQEAETDKDESNDFEVSILNVVVDHVMQYPTPLEPDEFQLSQQQQQESSSNPSNIKVPVMRIFGPIVSNLSNAHQTKPTQQYQQQSCCLHIHGAYPYMLARPTIAGPDNDMLSSLDDNDKNDSCWNNEMYLLSILEEMHHQLEQLLQSSLDHTTNKNDNKNDNKDNKNTNGMGMRLIRQLDVVYGRGFYTYCPGPPAPFLRIEYYNPQHRWRIKLLLERGLQISSFQNNNGDNNNNMNNNNMNNNNNTVTVFQCYEAHIPYTMQMFKDFHISGLSNVHVQDGRFRHELPKGPRPHKLATSRKTTLASNNNSSPMDQSSLLLRYNAPKSWRWPKSSSPIHSTHPQSNSQKVWPFDCYWTRKETSCDLELDTTVDHLRCRKNKNNYNDNHEDDWRAVPSLHEIWSQEQKRMTQLLSNSDDYFIDSLQQPKSTSLSGTKLALRGIHKLFTDSQLQEYKKAMIDILNNHKTFLDKIDTRLLNRKKKNDELQLKQYMLHNHILLDKMNVHKFSPLKLSQTFLNMSEEEEKNEDNDNEGNEIDHLNELIAHFDSCPSSTQKKEMSLSQTTVSSTTSPFSIHYYPPSTKNGDNKKNIENQLVVSANLFTPSPKIKKRSFLHSTPRLNYHYTPPFSDPVKSLCTPLKDITMKNIMMTPDEKNQVENDILSFGQRVDCGESVLLNPTQLSSSQQPFSQKQQLTPIINSQNEDEGFLENYINPATLTPYDDYDGGNSLDLDENQDEEEMTEEAMEKSLSMLDQPNLSRKNIRLEYDEKSKPSVSNNHTENFKGSIVPSTKSEVISKSNGFDCGYFSNAVDTDTVKQRLTIGEKDLAAQMTNSSSNMNEDVVQKPAGRQTDESLYDFSGSISVGEQCHDRIKITCHQDALHISQKKGNLNHINCCSILFEPNDKPPTRHKLIDATNVKTKKTRRFLPYSNCLALTETRSKGEEKIKPIVPEWLGFAKDLNSLYEKSFFKVRRNCTFYFGTIGDYSGVYLEPLHRPPSLQAVRSFLSKERKKKKVRLNAKRPSKQCETKGITNSKRIKQTCKIPNKDQNCDSDNERCNPAVSSTAFKCHKKRGNDGDGSILSSQMSPVSKKEKVSFTHEGITKDLISMSCAVAQVEKVELPHPTKSSSIEGIQEGLIDQNDVGSTTQLSLTPTATSMSVSPTQIESKSDPLQGIGQQGGRIHIEGGGGFKTNKYNSSPQDSKIDKKNHSLSSQQSLAIMSIEIHVQCRTGKSSHESGKTIAMRPDSTRDAVIAIVYVYAMDPGNGEKIHVIERGGIFTPTEAEAFHYQNNHASRDSGKLDAGNAFTMPDIGKNMGIASHVNMEVARNERQLLLRLASIVQCKDPDILVSWDTQGYGIGYLIERGAALGTIKEKNINLSHKAESIIDMVRLLGRTPRSSNLSQPSTDQFTDIGSVQDKDSREQNDNIIHSSWYGSGLGVEWDERVGAGAAASSIIGRLVLCGWKIMSEEVKHPNASYLQATAASVLGKRIPHHDDLLLSKWYANNRGRERWRVIAYRLMQASTTIFLLDTLDVIGRAGESARLSGVEFAQSFPGIRGSQYKVEGVLLRALQSVRSDERGDKKGIPNPKLTNYTSTFISTYLSHDSKSQSQSPWKLLRNNSSTAPTITTPHSSLSELENIGLNQKNTNKGYFFYSPSKDDCEHQEALECQALTLEPKSGFIFDPVVVCDFTALYPSLVIAYNLCYSTCAGKLEYHSTRSEMGCRGQTTGKIGPFQYNEKRTASVLQHHMKSLSNGMNGVINSSDRAYAVPTGSIFVSESVLKGVLPQVLDELLSTRAMLKKAAKEYKRLVPNLSPAILRQLEARQLALKYVANVTYGYTSATFSGRSAMPLVADSIVECGRRTLTNAINLANNWGKQQNGKWSGAEVVYGDTDSLFIRLPGRTIKEAFVFGEEFCKAVTASNPPPVQLKLEKVYGASLMQTKKKYCGMKYESPDQKPVFEAKGIETIRRDQCTLTKKILQNTLETLFEDGINAVKSYLYSQWSHIHTGNFPISDFILTGRVRSRYRGGKVGPVQAVLAKRLSEADPGRIVRHKERLPYVIVATPGQTFRLRDCVLTPLELLEQWDSYTIHAAYYITKHVNAALQRCLGLNPFKIDVNSWYEKSPKPRKRIHFWPVTRTGGSSMISAYFGSDLCALCGAKCKADGSARAVICSSCRNDTVRSSYKASMRLNMIQKQANGVAAVCQCCNGCIEDGNSFAQEIQIELSYNQNNAAALFPIQTRKQQSKGIGISNPMANCVCTDCPVTFERHRLKEAQLEARAVCKALDIF